jgi:deoxyhypusine synthase
MKNAENKRDNMNEDKFEKIKGFSIDSKMTIESLARNMKYMGFQATQIGRSIEIIEKMKKDSTIFLTFTSNMVSSGLREIFAQLVKNKSVDVIITSVGSIEEDLIKCEKPFLLGDFNFNDSELREKEINRIGNIFVPNDRYIHLEKILQPFFAEMFERQKKTGKMISPSELVFELGKKCNDKNSILYWATKNKIPVFCPGITDGALGLQLYFFKQDNKEFGIDVTADMNQLADIIYDSKKTGGIILGGGIAKHHAIGANIVRGGFDYAVYVTTATQYDGSLSGARTNEGVSWGKIQKEINTVCIEGDATIIFPLLTPFLLK